MYSQEHLSHYCGSKRILVAHTCECADSDLMRGLTSHLDSELDELTPLPMRNQFL